MSIQKARKQEIASLNIGEDGLPQIEATTELLREKKKEKEKMEFEERLKAAQAATEMEEGLPRRVVKGPAVHRERREEESHTATNATTAAVRKSESWRWWSRSGGSGSQESGSGSS
jgi:cobalamin-dependent methionine synthase I